uniref:WGS project CBMI000000000 data, contig CS3069_c002659 n=1 Tax=Fusarium clavum TaxID=2594811 RepID=A0A090MD26_9HYPO|nr:unnamed protein product [Fusarium clavum]
MVTSQETTPRQERREKVEKRVRLVLPDRTRSREPGQQSGDDYRESRYSHKEGRERSSRRYSRNDSSDDSRRRSRSPRYDGPRRYYRGSHYRFDSPDYGRERSHGRDQRQPRRHDSNCSRKSREDRTRTRDRGEPANQQGSSQSTNQRWAPGAPEATDDGPRGHNACLFPVHSISSVVDEIQRTVPGPQVDMVWGPRPIIRAMYEEFKAKNGLCTAHILPSRNDDEGDGNAY